MSVWLVVFILLAVGMIMGPISMLRPKPGQRRKENLRAQAAQQGVRFGLRKAPKLKTDMEDPEPTPAYYLAPTTKMQAMSTWTLMRTGYEHEGNFYRDWDWNGEYRPSAEASHLLREYLANLPESVTLISQGEAGTCLLWNEKEDAELLNVLIKLLKELQASVV